MSDTNNYPAAGNGTGNNTSGTPYVSDTKAGESSSTPRDAAGNPINPPRFFNQKVENNSTAQTPPPQSQPSSQYNSDTTINVKPKGLWGFLVAYIIFSLPGFIAGIIWIFVLLATVGMLGAIAGSVSGDKADKPEAAELSLSAVKEGNSSQGILIYDIRGPIMSGGKNLPAGDLSNSVYTDKVAQDFAKIKKDKKIKNVVFRVDTPGGEVFASKVLGDQIADLLKSLNQPQAVFYFDQTVASGGLWASYKQTNNYVVASEYGQTGSIGVMLSLPNFAGTAEKVGYKETILKSSPSKDYGNPLRDLSGPEQEFLQNQVNTEFQQFVEIVSTGRKLPADKVLEFANGFVYPNTQAKTLGLVDELGSMDRALKRAAENASLGENYSVWEMKPELGVFDELLGGTSFSSLLGVSKTVEKIEKASFLKNGTMYAIDDTKI